MKKILSAFLMAAIVISCTKSNDKPSGPDNSGYRIYLKASAPAQFTSLETSVLSDKQPVKGNFPTANAVLYTSVGENADIIVGTSSPATGYHILIEQNLAVLKQYDITMAASVIKFENVNPAKGDIWIYLEK
jgi:hypothetical protein